MAKPKAPFKRFPLPPKRGQVWSPPADKIEGTDVRNPGYHPGSAFTVAELEFIRAVDEYRRKSRRKFLSAADHLRVATSLGYAKTSKRKDRRMTPHRIVQRLLAAGFSFHLTNDEAGFRRPDADGVEVDALLALVAWRWGELEPLVREHLTATTETT